jgi:hypothetical protein
MRNTRLLIIPGVSEPVKEALAHKVNVLWLIQWGLTPSGPPISQLYRSPCRVALRVIESKFPTSDTSMASVRGEYPFREPYQRQRLHSVSARIYIRH